MLTDEEMCLAILALDRMASDDCFEVVDDERVCPEKLRNPEEWEAVMCNFIEARGGHPRDKPPAAWRKEPYVFTVGGIRRRWNPVTDEIVSYQMCVSRRSFLRVLKGDTAPIGPYPVTRFNDVNKCLTIGCRSYSVADVAELIWHLEEGCK